MNPIRNLLIESGVIKTGHFLLTSGRHSDIYCNKDAINMLPDVRNIIVKSLISKVRLMIPEDNSDYVITGPAVAGIAWANPVANALNLPFVYPEKDKVKVDVNNHFVDFEDAMVFRRGFDEFLKGKKVIIVEDIITTGKSIILTKKGIERCGGELVGVACIWNRNFWGNNVVDVDPILDNPVESWNKLNCPLCKEGIPLINPKTGLEV